MDEAKRPSSTRIVITTVTRRHLIRPLRDQLTSIDADRQHTAKQRKIQCDLIMYGAPQYGAGSCSCLSRWSGSIVLRVRHANLCNPVELSRFNVIDRRL